MRIRFLRTRLRNQYNRQANHKQNSEQQQRALILLPPTITLTPKRNTAIRALASRKSPL